MKYLIHKFIKKNVHKKINYYVKLFYTINFNVIFKSLNSLINHIVKCKLKFTYRVAVYVLTTTSVTHAAFQQGCLFAHTP